MNRYKTVLLALSIVFGLIGCGADVPGTAEGPFDAIDAYVAQSMEEHGTPGLTLAVTSRDELLYVGTYGFADLKLRKPVTEETLFQIGSISKSFTALALMHLWDEGALDLEKPFAEYLPWFSVQTEFPAITTHHLLSHSAGIPANRDDVAGSMFMPWALRTQSTAWAPGGKYLYSNVAFQALHFLVEELAGENYGTYIQRMILDPLEMRHTNPVILLESRPDQAVGYLQPFDDRPPHRSRPLVEAPFAEYGLGDGSIQSTAADMAAYARMLLNRGESVRGRIVSEGAFERFSTPHTKRTASFGGSSYGYGMGIRTRDGHDYLVHSGGMIGLYGLLVADMTDGVAVVLMVNGPADLYGIADYAISVMQASSAGSDLPPLPDVEDPAVVEKAPDYAGLFADGWGETLEFKAADGRLMLKHGDRDIVVERAGTDAFYTPHPGFDRYTFVFGRDDDDSVVALTHGPRWLTNDRYRGATEFSTPDEWGAYIGRYRSHSLWFSYFEIAIVKGNLVVITGEGGESSAGATVLVPKGGALFQVGTELTPEVLRFRDVVDGHALRAEWSGHQFHRVAW